MERRLALLLAWLLLGAGAARAQWVVSDPSNLAQGIVNSTNEMVHTSSTAQSMLQNFQQTVKIYEQNKKYYYGHEIEMYTIEQGEKRDKRQ